MRAAVLAAALALAGCARAAADNECTGAAPLCYESAAPGCCADAGVPAECGPKDAPRGTHLKWVCPGKSVRVTECTAYGPACAEHAEQVAATLATPHAVPLAGDPAGLPQGWLDAGAGAVLADRTEQLSTFYSVRKYTTRTKGPENVRDHEDLYFGKDRLTADKRDFVAPSGDFVVFEDGTSPKLSVHGAVSGKKRDLVPKPYESPTGAAFDTQKRTVTVSFTKRAAMTAKLP